MIKRTCNSTAAIAMALTIVSPASPFAETPLTEAPSGLVLESAGSGAVTGAPIEFGCEGTILWDQLPPDPGNGMASQDDVCYPFSMETADDVTFDVPTTISGVEWWGDVLIVSDFDFRVTIYADDEARPGAVVHQTSQSDFIWGSSDEGSYGFCLLPDPPIALAPGRYWLSIVAVYCFPPQWFINAGTGNGTETYFRSEWFGFDDWTTATEVFGDPREMAFRLREDPSVPVDEVTWAGLRALYGR